LGLTLLTLLVYLPVIWAGFVWDDLYLISNPLVKAPDGLLKIWFGFEGRDYFPLSYSGFWLQWRLWGLHPLGYHVVNVVLHLACALLLWRILVRVAVPGAWLAALLFAVHPVNVETAAWISEQKNTLAMVFFLLSVWVWRRQPDSGNGWLLAGSLVCFALSLLAKPMAVLWPPVLAGYVWWSRGRLDRSDALRILPFFLVSAASAAVTLACHKAEALAGLSVGPETISGRLILAGQALLFYASKMVVPTGLCAIYPRDALRWFNPGSVVLAALLLVVLAAPRERRYAWLGAVALGLAFFVAMLAPVLGLVDISFMFYSPVSDHFAYAASAGMMALLCGVGVDLFRRRAPAAQRKGGVLICLIVVAFAALSFGRVGVFMNSERLFRDTLVGNPRAWAAHVTLGNMAFDRRSLAEAEVFYRQGLRLKPDYWEAYNGLGIVYAVQGRFDQAIPMFRKTLELKPDHHIARRNLEKALQDQARLPKPLSVEREP
jgi:hypothetical protein